jgi:endonuclease-3
VKRAEKAERIRKVLDELFPELAIPLRHEDPFTLLVAVVLSAQCSDARVNEVTPALFARARNPEALAALPLPLLRGLIRPCGLGPQKARHLRELSRRLVERHAGRVPASFAELEALPGVGHKTASVVMAQAFGQPAFPVDTHIHRLAARWGLSSGRNVAQTERDLKRLFPEESWGRVHLQLILFGRRFCPARGHDPTACPICSWAAPRRRRLSGARRPRRARGSRARANARGPRPRARSAEPRRPRAPR